MDAFEDDNFIFILCTKIYNCLKEIACLLMLLRLNDLVC